MCFSFSDRGGGGGGDNFMGRGGNFGGDNFGRGKMTCDTVHLILCVSLYCSTSGVNNTVVNTLNPVSFTGGYGGGRGGYGGDGYNGFGGDNIMILT